MDSDTQVALNGGSYWKVIGYLIGVFGVLVWPVVLTFDSSKYHPSSEYRDQVVAHEPTIKKMAAVWPALDPVNYGIPGITCGPAYYYIIAGVARVTSNVRVWQLASSLFGLLALCQVFHYCSRFTRPVIGGILCLPFLFCPYFLGTSIWLMTDNAALASAFPIIVGPAIYSPRVGRQLRWGIYSAFAVANRQLYVWLAFPVIVSGFLTGKRSLTADSATDECSASQRRSRYLVLGGVAGACIPVFVLAYFAWGWHGLLPPTPRGINELLIERDLLNPALFTVAFGQLGVYGVFFLPLLPANRIRGSIRSRLSWIALAVGLIVSLAWPTEFSVEGGRWGGSLWTASRLFPAIWERSTMWPPLAIAGAFVLLCFWNAADSDSTRRRLIYWYACLAMFLLVNAANPYPSQRYTEPMLLALLAWWSAIVVGSTSIRPWQLTGPIALAIFMFALAVFRVYIRAYNPEFGLT